MPLESTSRIFVAFRVMPMPGTVMPEAANTPFMPVRAFGAPQTTCTMPSLVSTSHTRSRSAFGCCRASFT